MRRIRILYTCMITRARSNYTIPVSLVCAHHIIKSLIMYRYTYSAARREVSGRVIIALCVYVHNVFAVRRDVVGRGLPRTAPELVEPREGAEGGGEENK